MHKRGIKLMSLTTASMMIFTSLAFANDNNGNNQSRPNGPYVELEQNLSISSFLSNSQLKSKLEQFEKTSKGTMTLEIAGFSNRYPESPNKVVDQTTEDLGFNNPLYVAKFGDPNTAKRKILITTQIHGNEPLGTEAAVDLVKTLATGSKEVKEILKDTCIWIMPRINPDGASNTYEGSVYQTRYSLQKWNPTDFGLDSDTDAPWYYNLGNERAQGNNGRVDYGVPGFDQNRDYNPNLDLRIDNITNYDMNKVLNGITTAKNTNGITRKLDSSSFGGFYVTPEARIVTKVYKQLKPDVYIDIHHRGFNTLSDEDNRSVSVQVAAEVADPYTDPYTGNLYKTDDDVLALSRKINLAAANAFKSGNASIGAIQRYSKTDLPGTCLGAFALNNSSIMLIEIKGQTQTLGQKQSGMLVQGVKNSVYKVIKGLNDGSVEKLNDQDYYNIPVSTNGIKDPSVRD